MASSSISSIQKSFKYDLFLSFRGKDTRKTFVDHLYYALQRQGINTFKDDKRLKKGKRIDNELIKAIEDSKLFIIVFSKTYSSSSWCLDELVKIIECHKTTEQIAYPVFYDVEPNEVRKQSGVFGEAFAKHEFEESFGKWREALEEAAKLAGWELKNTADGHEAEFIKQIVEEIFIKLCSIHFSVDEKLVGMDSRIKDVELLLETGFDDVRMIGIKGIGGGGKTTLARALFDKISIHFEGKSFVENVRDSQSSLTGLKSLQKQVLSDLLNIKDIDVSCVYDGKNLMKKMLSSRKVILVLDGVDHIQQLEVLAGEPSWFMAGSRIIITTRDEQVLLAHGVKRIHNVNLLSDNETTCLFSRYAFGRDAPVQGYKDLSLKVVSYVAGLPLTAKVLGSFLRDKNELEWIDALERLKTFPEKETKKILELSYIGLEEDYKEIFLNVACFMEAWKKDDAIHVLECCGFHARTGLKVLEQKSLITIFQDDFHLECIDMHDLIKEMGRNIARGLHPNEPSTHSRLWISEEIKDVLANDLGTHATKYINLGYVGFCPEIYMKGFGNMEKLIFLNVKASWWSGDCSSFKDENSSNYMKIDQVKQYFPNSLRYLRWDRDTYHHWCLPNSFQANNLVGLRMRWSRIKQLWEEGDRKVMKKLKFLDFSYSKLKMLDLEMTPNLERLDLTGCNYLEKLDTPYGYLLKLKSLYLSDSKLRTIDLRQALNIEMLNIKECHDLVELHLAAKCPKLTYLNLHRLSKLRELNLGLTPNLETFHFEESHDLVEFHMSAGCLKLKSLRLHLSYSTTLDLGLTPNLEYLYTKECHNLVKFQALIDGCPKLKSLKIINANLKTLNLGLAQNLEELYLEECADLVEFYMPVRCPKLRSLDLIHSKLRTLKLGLTPSLQNLHLAHCHNLLTLHMPVGCPALEYVGISGSKLRTLELGLTPNLQTLHIIRCYDLIKFHMPDRCLKLRELHVDHSKLRNLDLQLTPNLVELELQECDELVELHMPVNGCSKLRWLYLRHLKLRILDLRLTSDLYSLEIEDCHDLVQLRMPVGCSELRILNIRHSMLRNLDLGMAPNLENLHIEECHDQVQHDVPVGCVKGLGCIDLSVRSRLKAFDLEKKWGSGVFHLSAESIDTCPLDTNHSLPKFRFSCVYEEQEQPCATTRNLQEFVSLANCCIRNFTSFSENICGLQSLRQLTLHGSIPEMPKHLEQLEFLEELVLSSIEAQHLPNSICILKHLKSLKLEFCLLLQKLPEEIGQIECLEELILNECTSLTDIPISICKMKRLKKIILAFCTRVEKLPEELGRLECLEVLYVIGTGISWLPESISLLKGLCVVGYVSLLQSCGFASQIHELVDSDGTCCYIYVE